jgi:hypothetical protein
VPFPALDPLPRLAELYSDRGSAVVAGPLAGCVLPGLGSAELLSPGEADADRGIGPDVEMRIAGVEFDGNRFAGTSRREHEQRP